MKILIVASFVFVALAVPALAHPHGAKSKRDHNKTYRTYRPKAAYRRYRDDTCPVRPDPHFQDYPYWAACAFTSKSFR